MIYKDDIIYEIAYTIGSDLSLPMAHLSPKSRELINQFILTFKDEERAKLLSTINDMLDHKGYYEHQMSSISINKTVIAIRSHFITVETVFNMATPYFNLNEITKVRADVPYVSPTYHCTQCAAGAIAKQAVREDVLLYESQPYVAEDMPQPRKPLFTNPFGKHESYSRPSPFTQPTEAPQRPPVEIKTTPLNISPASPDNTVIPIIQNDLLTRGQPHVPLKPLTTPKKKKSLFRILFPPADEIRAKKHQKK